MTTPIDPPLTLRAPDMPEHLFSTFEELQDWAASEAQAWASWQDQSYRGHQDPLRVWADTVLASSRFILDRTNNALHGDPKEHQNLRSQLDQELQKYANNQSIASGSPDGQRLIGRYNDGDRDGAVLESMFVVRRKWANHQIVLSLSGHQNVAVPAYDFVAAISGSVISEKILNQNLEADQKSHQIILKEFEARLNERIQKFELRNSELQTANQKLEGDIQRSRKKMTFSERP